jgi:hypothetical protein
MRRVSEFWQDRSVTNKIILVNIAVFVAVTIFLMFNQGFLDYVALKPSNILQGKMLWTIFTSMFMHGSVAHLFVNMLSLFFIGNFVERLIGRKRFLIFYILAGLVAAMFFVLLAFVFSSEMNSYAVGASGAIFALGALLMILVPRLPVLVFFVLPMPLWLGMLVLLFGIWILSYFAGIPIGNTAHLGGFLIGLAYGIWLRIKYKKKVRMLSYYVTR